MNLNTLERPVFLVDKTKVLRNAERMTQKARESGVSLRPHFKTHQSADVAAWLRDLGVRQITVSSLEMAEYFARNGWADITIAVPVNIHQIPRIDTLAKTVNLHVIIDSEFAAAGLGEGIAGPLNVWVEVDTGDHRTGIPAERIHQILDTARRVGRASALCFQGILTHDGQTYDAAGVGDMSIHEKSRAMLQTIKHALEEGGFSPCLVSMGDTPSWTLVDRFRPPISEIRPGNFVFYDLKQKSLGVAAGTRTSRAAAFPVISKNASRGSWWSMRQRPPARHRCLFPRASRSSGRSPGSPRTRAAGRRPFPEVDPAAYPRSTARSRDPRILCARSRSERHSSLPFTPASRPACSEYYIIGDGVAGKFRP